MLPTREIHPSKGPLNSTRDSHTLVLDHLPLVRAIAWQVYASLPVCATVEIGDVVQAGHVGLVDASRSYHPGVRVPFGSYARHRIRGEILDSLRRLDSASRGLRRWQRLMEAETRDLTVSLNREPSEEEVSQGLGIGVDSLRKRRLALWYTSVCSHPTPKLGDSAECVRTTPALSEANPDRLYSNRQMRHFLSRAIAVLPLRPRKVVLLYYMQNLTMKQIGARLGVQESRISQIHKGALGVLAQRLKAAGVTALRDL